MSTSLDRRDFLRAAAATAALGALTHLGQIRGADAPAKRPKLKKAVKYDMIKIKGTPRDKFELVKRLGFLGVEINSPSDIDRKAAVEAQAETGIKIHGVIDS